MMKLHEEIWRMSWWKYIKKFEECHDEITSRNLKQKIMMKLHQEKYLVSKDSKFSTKVQQHGSMIW